MNTLPKAELITLTKRKAGIHVSLFMPVHRAGAEAQQDPIRFRNLLRQAEEQLRKNRYRPQDAKLFLAAAYQLLDDGDFWRHQSTGLAIFIAPDLFRQYSLPLPVEALVVVAPHFHIRPLLPLFAGDDQFYILALYQDRVRLLHNTEHGIKEINLAGLPQSRATALQTESFGKQISSRGVGTVPVGGGHAPAMFYSHSNENAKEMIVQYFHQVDKVLRDMLHGDEAPVILAGVEYLHPIYREISQGIPLASEGIFGNLDRFDLEVIQRRARAIVQAQRRKKREAALNAYRQIADTKHALSDIQAIVCAAYQQRVSTLFVDLYTLLWGSFDPMAGSVSAMHVQRDVGDEDLFNLAAIYTLANGGAIQVVEPETLPAYQPVAAILRY